MADWKTYVKAARNTARKQAPAAKDAARRAGDRAGGYARAAGRAVDEGWREDGRRASAGADERDAYRERDVDRDREARGEREDEHRSADPEGRRRSADPEGRRRSADRDGGTRTAQRPRPSGEELRREAAAYYAVASRHVERANIFPRIMRALRDALLIGLSLVVIWAVLAAAGIPIPFTTVLIAVGLIVVVSFGAGLYAQWKRSRERLDQAEDPRDR
ncbi:hypothetical protein [Brachybacterium paraconglomeratum]|uniref:hypothetical protein n=1 Tax=Brachybacterium paraconglomeratum TaxID=173362 RepID=UPI0022AEBC08|nr:hypothetical protein [Brachybacterium paraconglomeratum]MCZ4325506.1 hypothetical protein [Brachybacterium paraconglomeratum]